MNGSKIVDLQKKLEVREVAKIQAGVKSHALSPKYIECEATGDET